MAYAPYPTELLEFILKILRDDGNYDSHSALAYIRSRCGLPERFFDRNEPINDIESSSLTASPGQKKAELSSELVACNETEALQRLEMRWLDRKSDFSPMLDDEPSKSWKIVQAQLLGIDSRLTCVWRHVGYLGVKVDWLGSLLDRDDLLTTAAAITAMACGDSVFFEESGTMALHEDRGPRVPPPHEWRDRKDGSLLHHAASARAVRLLVDLVPGFGAPPPPLSDFGGGGDGLTPLSSLLDSGQSGELGKGLVGHRQREGYSPLHFATTAAQARALVARGAPVRSVTNGGLTCLFSCRTAPLARCLLALGADPLAESLYQHTALHLAASHGLWEVVWVLLEGGSDALAKGLDGHTPLTLVERILAGVPRTTANPSSNQGGGGGGGEEAAAVVSLPSNRNDLVKTAKILSLWVTLLDGEAQRASKTGRHRLFRKLETAVSAATHAFIARDPVVSLADCTGFPLELATLILGRYVGVFSGPRDLMDDDDDYDEVEGTKEMDKNKPSAPHALDESRRRKRGGDAMHLSRHLGVRGGDVPRRERWRVRRGAAYEQPATPTSSLSPLSRDAAVIMWQSLSQPASTSHPWVVVIAAVIVALMSVVVAAAN